MNPAAPADGLVLALDLGTGGCKASTWSPDGTCVRETVHTYPTTHPAPGRAEQRPEDWWDAVVRATRDVLDPAAAHAVRAVALSGQSLGVVQVDQHLDLVGDRTPIWSDTRGGTGTAEFFSRVPEHDWYLRTGNGFPPGLYPAFKVAALRREDPDAWARTRYLLGSKDFVNLRLTGTVATDHSHASGSGAYDLERGGYADDLLDAAGLDAAKLPTPREAFDTVGGLTPDAAVALRLPPGTPVVAGAVDNACMALGSRGTRPGRTYAALGSSSWITTTADRPLLDVTARPYVFRHALPGTFISALSTFSSGTSLGWLHRLLAPGATLAEFIATGLTAPPGAGGLLFLPMLAGGTPLEGGPRARGALTGLHLGAEPADVVRAALEGIAFALRRSLSRMQELGAGAGGLLIAGGGARDDGLNQLYADVLGLPLERTTVDQQAATLGAAALAFTALGDWELPDADRAHRTVARYVPDPATAAAHDDARTRFDAAVAALAPGQDPPA